MKSEKFDKQKLLASFVTVLLVFFFIGGFLLGLDRVRSMEGTFPPNELKEGIWRAPETAEEALVLLEIVTDTALEENPAVTFDDYFEINADSLSTSKSDTFSSAVKFALGNFTNHISTVEENEAVKNSVNFGEELDALLRLPDLSEYKLVDFTCNYIYYQCPSCSEKSDVKLDYCEKCGSKREYFLKYHDEYDISFNVIEADSDGDGTAIAESFFKRSPEQIAALYSTALGDDIKVNKVDISYNQYRINYKVKRLTPVITYLLISKDMSVRADAQLSGKYEALGNVQASFELTENYRYNFTWPSITLNESTLVIEPKGTDNLLATLSCEDPLSMNVSWSSSDESIVTVDKDGYLYTTKKTGSAVISASFEYLGKIYTDTCQVHVRVPVEAMKMNKKNVSLDIGEAVVLETKVSPSDATVKTVKWYSEDDSIAVVSDDGTVSAKNSGTVVIYAISDDGYYRSTCEVTVK